MCTDSISVDNDSCSVIIKQLCKFPNCNQPATISDYCNQHYQVVHKNYKKQQERAVIKPPTTRKKRAITSTT